MDVYLTLCLVFGLTVQVLAASGYEFDPEYLIPPKCKPCNAKSCPQLTYCVGKVVKDNCGCCPRCSSEFYPPNAQGAGPTPVNGVNKVNMTGVQEVDPCKQRQCPKFKVCMINVQGLPICTCPSPHVCNKRRGKRANQHVDMALCGSDGKTYPSKCHLRLANCNSIKRIKRLHVGACMKTGDRPDAPNNVGNGVTGAGSMIQSQLSKKEERARLKALKRAKRKKMKKRKRKNRRLRKKEKKERKEREKYRRRSKRRNNIFTPYSSYYDFLLRKRTNWAHEQVRKSRI